MLGPFGGGGIGGFAPSELMSLRPHSALGPVPPPRLFMPANKGGGGGGAGSWPRDTLRPPSPPHWTPRPVLPPPPSTAAGSGGSDDGWEGSDQQAANGLLVLFSGHGVGGAGASGLAEGAGGLGDRGKKRLAPETEEEEQGTEYVEHVVVCSFGERIDNLSRLRLSCLLVD